MKNLNQLSSLFIVGVRNLKSTDELFSFLDEYPASGVALFNAPHDSTDFIWKNPAEGMEILHEFVCKIKERNLFLCVDQEGGRVQRLRGDFIRLPPAQQFYSVRERTDLLFELYSLVAMQLKNSGIRLNFAPVCDLWQSGCSESIGDRSYSHNLKEVLPLLQTYCEAFESSGVHTTLKHFPGLGSSEIDSHEAVALLQKTKREVDEHDLFAFSETAPHSSAIMTAHLAFPETPDRIFSLDKDWLQKYRSKLPSHLAWITDDLVTMKAVSEQKPWIAAYEAGYDYLLLCGSLDQSAKAIEETIQHIEKEISSFQKEQALELKLRHCQERFEKPEIEENFKKWILSIQEGSERAGDIFEKLDITSPNE